MDRLTLGFILWAYLFATALAGLIFTVGMAALGWRGYVSITDFLQVVFMMSVFLFAFGLPAYASIRWFLRKKEAISVSHAMALGGICGACSYLLMEITAGFGSQSQIQEALLFVISYAATGPIYVRLERMTRTWHDRTRDYLDRADE